MVYSRHLSIRPCIQSQSYVVCLQFRIRIILKSQKSDIVCFSFQVETRTALTEITVGNIDRSVEKYLYDTLKKWSQTIFWHLTMYLSFQDNLSIWNGNLYSYIYIILFHRWSVNNMGSSFRYVHVMKPVFSMSLSIFCHYCIILKPFNF